MWATVGSLVDLGVRKCRSLAFFPSSPQPSSPSRRARRAPPVPVPIGGGTSSDAGVIVGSASSPSLRHGPDRAERDDAVHPRRGQRDLVDLHRRAAPRPGRPSQPRASRRHRTGVTGQLGTLTRAGRHDPGHVRRPAALLLAGRHEGRRRDRQRCRGLLDRDGRVGLVPRPSASAAAPAPSSVGKYGY